MCHYCGCREIPLIKEFIAEHESVTDAAGGALRALDSGDQGLAAELVARMGRELRAHWQGEEQGLFAVMGGDEEYAGYVDALVREHRELAGFLDQVDLGRAEDVVRLREAVDELYHHIAKEEDGLFPASLTALSGDDWDLSMAAWCTAHPDARGDL
ncbi:hemerythrin domain-containing protein [Streptomyces poriferorum]|uniref:Hemerythrin domain-containing protein n=1 Tax=Streptomyces poriferorum TaxID=2798799 RepID=A0ABY9INU3_9ACTN|nr:MULTISPECIES: hemerythrin domain-containing protein [unclassified Streptomyces]MDP5314060.1 hemerythrin domain-containing protein [Streptomyces sp. Alt4]WLQ50330.1 hemerythrin domain-containing protein [Streptomyces sp. Alt1]WLQ57003.1 hemerythrin domain-containing protein [Streptomyces sp. Alt2]